MFVNKPPTRDFGLRRFGSLPSFSHDRTHFHANHSDTRLQTMLGQTVKWVSLRDPFLFPGQFSASKDDAVYGQQRTNNIRMQ